MHCFWCRLLSDSLRLNEHQAAVWLTTGNLMSVKWLPADEGLVKQRAEYCATDILVLGIHTVPDFALNIGKAYAWRKGLISVEALT